MEPDLAISPEIQVGRDSLVVKLPLQLGEPPREWLTAYRLLAKRQRIPVKAYIEGDRCWLWVSGRLDMPTDQVLARLQTAVSMVGKANEHGGQSADAAVDLWTVVEQWWAGLERPRAN